MSSPSSYDEWHCRSENCDVEYDSFKSLSVHHRFNHEGRPEEVMQEALQAFAEELGHTPTIKEMDSEGPLTSGSYTNLYSTWGLALRDAGLEPNKESYIDEERLIDALQNLAEEIGHSPRQKNMCQQGPFGTYPYMRNFGCWNEALKEAGLEVNREVSNDVSKEKLIQELKRVAEEIGEVPSYAQMDEESQYSSGVYQNYFECWNEAVREAGYEPFTRNLPPFTRRNFYGPNWREQREKALERDRYKCVICSMSNEAHSVSYGQSLHVHHMKPMQKFEPFDGPEDPKYEEANRLSNLMTLCNPCHHRWEGVELQRPDA